MSKSVVPAAAVAHAKRLVQNKKLAKQHEAQQPAQDEPQAAVHKEEAANVVHQDAQPQSLSMSDASLGGFSFSGALADAASSAASLTVATSAQDDGGYSDSDNGSDGSGTILLVGAVGLVGAGIAVLASGGNDGKSNEAAPVFTSGTSASVDENAAATTVVYKAAATDADGDPITYTLGGTDAGAFNISATGDVTLKNPADFETKNSYAFSVIASDGEHSTTQNVTLTVVDKNDAPVITSDAEATIAENSPIATVVYHAVATDQDDDAITFSLTGDDAGAFNINAETGEVTLKAPADFETKDSYSFNVVASDGTAETTKAVTLHITDVDPEDAHTTFSLDDISTPTSSTVVDAGTASFIFTDDSSKTSNIILSNFSDDDIIHVSGISALTTYSYTTGGADGQDLRIEYQDTTTQAITSIVIVDAIANAGAVYDYATAVNAVGFDFMTIA